MKNKSHVLLSVFALCFVYGVNAALALSWDPLTDAGTNLVGWYDASDGSTVLTSGTTVTNWLDKSANGNDLDTRSSNVYFDGYDINGLTTVRFSYMGKLYTAAMTATNLSEVCLITVAEYMSGYGDGSEYGTLTSTDGKLQIYTYKNSDWLQANITIGGSSISPKTATDPSLADDTPLIGAAYYDGDYGYIRANGGVVSSSNDLPNGATFTLNQITAGRTGGTANYLYGEMIALNTADIKTIEKVEGYLAHKWGLYSSLPTDHPYRYHEPDAPIPFGALSVSNITSTSAELYVVAESNLISATVVWDTSDRGMTNVTDWGWSNTVSGIPSTPGEITGTATGLTADTEYFFRFYGEDGSTNDWSTELSFSTPLSASTPSFTTVSGAYNEVTLQWNDNADTETAYILQRATNGTDFSLLTTLAADTTNYTDGAVVASRTYYYRLAATNSANGSATDPAACETNAFTAFAENMIFYDSFEDPVIDGNVTNLPTGWTQAGDWNKLSDDAVTGKTGDQFAKVHGGGDTYAMTTTSSILSSNLLGGVAYTLTCDASWNDDRSSPTAIMRFIAGSTVIAATTNAIIGKNNLSQNTLTINLVTPTDHPNIGETLSISLSRTNGWGNSDAWFDNLAVYAEDLSGDTTPPTPTNMVFMDLPTSSVSNSITMMATNATDDAGVQYFFTNTVNGNVSGWQDSRIWTDTGLTPGDTYSYRVKARDTSPSLNETPFSSAESAECEPYIVLYESFEEPSILPNTLVSFNTFPLPPSGWDYLKGSALDVWNEQAITAKTPFGEQFVAMRSGNSWIAATNLGHVLEAEYIYRVTFNAGGMEGDGSVAKPATHQVELIAGSTIVASNVFSTTDFDFSETNMLEFIPDIANTNLGDAISLKLWTTATPIYWNDRGMIDNIKLYAIPPNPKGTLLIIR